MARGLQPRQRKFVQGVANGKSQRQAALDAGYSEYQANSPKQKILTGRAIREYFASLLPSEPLIAKAFHDGLKAQRVQRLVVKGRVEEFSDPDHGERLRAARLCANFKGIAEMQSVQVSGDTENPVRWQIEVVGNGHSPRSLKACPIDGEGEIIDVTPILPEENL